MSGSYHVVGRVCVERYQPEEGEEFGDVEVLDVLGFSDISDHPNESEEVSMSLYDKEDVPKEPGQYILMYAGSFYPTQDYWGEYDVNVEIDWFQVKRFVAEKDKDPLKELGFVFSTTDV